MKKQFIITQTVKNYIKRMWYFSAENIEDLAVHIVSNDKKYAHLFRTLGRKESWDPQNIRYKRPTPDEFLAAIENAYNDSHQSHYFQIHAFDPANEDEYFARWLSRDGVSYIPEIDNAAVM